MSRAFAPAWLDSALCAQVGPSSFFPEQGQYDLVREAKATCAACDVRLACLAYALERDDVGVWGAMTQTERRALQQQQRRAS